LHDRAGTTRDSLTGLQRWRYVVVGPDPQDARAKPRRDDLLVRPTAAGRRAQDIWRPLARVVEARWHARFGTEDVQRLREALLAIARRLDTALPDYLPLVYPTQNGKAEVPKPSTRGARTAPDVDLSVLLSRVLLTFTVDFEQESAISLPTSANALRVLDETGVRVRELPRLTGVSKEANAMSVGFLQRHGLVSVEPDPSASRGKVVRLTPKGRKAQDKYHRLLGATEESWLTRFGSDDIRELRESLGRLVGPQPNAGLSPLFAGLEPYPDGWRASVRRPDTLPHYPMVLHRGGYPDGS
jgi:DNA-binding MarR family transcriptional regulator